MPLNCPGYNANVLAAPAHGQGIGDAANQAQADAEAKAKAEAEALARAWAQVGSHACPPGCQTVPIIHLVDSGFIPVPAQPGAKRFASIGWADAQLDIQCIPVSAPPPVPQPPQSPQPPPGKTWGQTFEEWLWWFVELERRRQEYHRIFGDD